MQMKTKIGTGDLEGATVGTFWGKIRGAEQITTDKGLSWRFLGQCVLIIYDEAGEVLGEITSACMYLPKSAEQYVLDGLVGMWGKPEQTKVTVSGKEQDSVAVYAESAEGYAEVIFNVRAVADENSPVKYRWEVEVPNLTAAQLVAPEAMEKIAAAAPLAQLEAGKRKGGKKSSS